MASRGAASRAAGRARLRLRALATLAFVAIPLAGALVAGLLLPWLAGPGLAARSSVDLLTPQAGADATLAGNTAVLAADGSVITYFYRNNRIPVGADQIAPVMKQALVDIEDSRFYEHNGLDVEGTLRALLRNLRAGTVLEGG